jgi:hypothetical protein
LEAGGTLNDWDNGFDFRQAAEVHFTFLGDSPWAKKRFKSSDLSIENWSLKICHWLSSPNRRLAAVFCPFWLSQWTFPRCGKVGRIPPPGRSPAGPEATRPE